MTSEQIVTRSALLREWVVSAWHSLIALTRDRLSTGHVQQSERQIRVVLSDHDVAVFSITRGASGEIARLPLKDAEGGELTSLISQNERLALGETIVNLPAGDILRKTMHLPLKAAGNLRNILRYELDRHSPIDPSQVYFDYWVNARDKAANKLEVELRIVKRGSIDRAIALCRSLGLEPVSVGVEGDIIPLNHADLPLNRAAVIRSLWRRWSVPALAVLVLVLVVCTVAASFARNDLAAAVLDVRVEVARTKAVAVQRLRDEIAGAEKRATFLAGEKRTAMAVHVLSELTSAIPDGTWIYSFQLTGREVRIRGFSASASALIGAFDKSGFFTNAQFRAPLTQGPQGGNERFDLSADMKETSP